MKPKTILIVEDEALQLSALKNAFEREGYTVYTAENGRDGLTEAHHSMPSVILMDLVMPLGDGITLLYKINTDPGLRSIPIIILTNLAMDEKIKQMMNLTKDHFITKTNHSLQQIVEIVKKIA